MSRSPDNVYNVAKTLSLQYGDWGHYNRKNPLEELLFILCSIQTNEQLYRRTYLQLKKNFPTFESLAEATEKQIARSIAIGGLSTQKARAIKRLVTEIVARFDRPTLAPLKHLSDQERECFLLSLPGVGLKTARCVMMYSYKSPVFPVDVHCWRICRRLGWVRATRRDKSCSVKDMIRTQEKIPSDIRASLHVNMVSHGRKICTARTPACSECCISSYCGRLGVKDGR